MRYADAIIADSGFTADRIRSRFGREAHVTSLAPPSRFVPPEPSHVNAVRRRYDLPSDFVLYVGAIEPRKDTATLALACEIAKIPLIIAGRIRKPSQPPRGARVLGYVADSDLAALYGAATVMAYPSVYEGFGLPPLEAMACGTPVVAYRIPALLEVVGDAAMLTTPHNPDELAAALATVRVDHDHREALVAAGRTRVAELSWAFTAAATRVVYRDLGVEC
jgi:glycosyltransferase involved in cell wall biosynthesis